MWESLPTSYPPSELEMRERQEAVGHCRPAGAEPTGASPPPPRGVIPTEDIRTRDLLFPTLLPFTLSALAKGRLSRRPKPAANPLAPSASSPFYREISGNECLSGRSFTKLFEPILCSRDISFDLIWRWQWCRSFSGLRMLVPRILCHEIVDQNAIS